MSDVRTAVLDPGGAPVLQQLVALFYDTSISHDEAGAWLAGDQQVAIAAWCDGVPAGFLWGHFLPRPDARSDLLLIYSVDTHESHRRRGVATALLQAARAIGRGGIWLVTNESNQPAMNLYKKAGGKRPNNDDVMFEF